MAFPVEVRTKVLLWSDRHCCLCKKPCGANIEVHHIVPGGSDDIENAIPLCFDCHGHVHHYSEEHPVGTKFKPEEIRARREQVYEDFTRHLIPALHYEITQLLPSNLRRSFPDVGFTITHLGDSLPVQVRVKLEFLRNGTQSAPMQGHYSGNELWHLNPHSNVFGHFEFPGGTPKDDDVIAVLANVAVIDVYARKHENLRVAWVYMPKENDWYFEPCPSVLTKISPAGAG